MGGWGVLVGGQWLVWNKTCVLKERSVSSSSSHGTGLGPEPSWGGGPRRMLGFMGTLPGDPKVPHSIQDDHGHLDRVRVLRGLCGWGENSLWLRTYAS